MPGRHLGANEAWTRADALPPRPEPSIEQTLALGSQSENCQHWSRVQVGQADGLAGEPGASSINPEITARQTSAGGKEAAIRCSSGAAPLAGRETRST
jgi:hypothetical protein